VFVATASILVGRLSIYLAAHRSGSSRFERLRVRNSRKPQNMLARQVRFGFCG
jgi:hypothetical protein